MLGEPNQLLPQLAGANVAPFPEAGDSFAIVEDGLADSRIGSTGGGGIGVDQAKERVDVGHGGKNMGNFPHRATDIFPFGDLTAVGHIPNMVRGPKKQPKSRMDALYRRIVTKCVALGKSPRAASIEAGLGETFVKDIKRKSSMPSATNLAKLATVIGETAATLLGDDRAADGAATASGSSARGVPYLGEVAAGRWLETPPFELGDTTVPLVDVRFPFEAQYTVGVEGTSLNKIARPGTMLLCVDLARAPVQVANGDLVVVQRRRGDGALTEVTAKRFRRRSASVIELMPESDDPRWQEAIVLDEKKAAADEEVAVIAWVSTIIRQPNTPPEA